MKDQDALASVIEDYRKGLLSLDALSFRLELLLTRVASERGDQQLATALNASYIIEEINAMVLAEDREQTDEDASEVTRLLNLIERTADMGKEFASDMMMKQSLDQAISTVR